MREVRIIEELDHKNIVKYYETYDDQKYLYLVMQNCPGGELFDSFDRFEKLGKMYSEGLTAQIIHSCLSALQHCHSLDIVHRDIKPENLVIDDDGYVRITDFGIARVWRPENA